MASWACYTSRIAEPAVSARRSTNVLDAQKARSTIAGMSFIRPQARSLYHRPALRAAELARLLASVLFSRRTWEIEKSSDRASFRQIQFRE